MLLRRRALSALIATALTTATAVVTMPPAQASLCEGSYFYEVSSPKDIKMKAGPAYKDGPGGTISASVTKATTITSSASVSAGATLKGIIAEAKVEVSASITKSNSVTVGHAYSHKIKKDKYGHLQYVVWGKRVNWKYIYESKSCHRTTKASGKAKLTTKEEGWYFWQTSS